MGSVVGTITAQRHTVYFLDGSGRLIDEPRRVAHGQSAPPPSYTPPEGHQFLKWSRDTARVTEDVYCVALTKATEPTPPPEQRHHQEEPPQTYRVYVLDVRGSCPGGSLLPLGNWTAGEAIGREDLACLHLHRTGILRPFRLYVNCDTMLTLTDAGVRAFDRNSMRPLELLERVPHAAEIQAA